MKHAREVALFLAGMLGVALALFAGGWVLIRGSGLLLRAWFRFFSFLPHSIALALAVIVTALCVYAGYYLLAERRRKARIHA